jgi:aminoglycoside 3-N-acetyltransferase
MSKSYTYDELIAAYRALGVGSGKTIYVTSDLGRLMAFERPGKEAVLEAHFNALMSLIGPEGTLVVPTASLNLCNTDTPFDLENTPSFMVGALSEYVRKKPGALRSFHPFVSYTALGKHAEFVTQNVARHSYGPETPEGRMSELDALSISVGLHPRFSCSTTHHVEHLMAVPYRYTREYLHPVVREGKTIIEPFYMYVWYRNSDIKRDHVKKIFFTYESRQNIDNVSLGRAIIYAYPMNNMIKEMSRMFAIDPYIWCEFSPQIRPWRE